MFSYSCPLCNWMQKPTSDLLLMCRLLWLDFARWLWRSGHRAKCSGIGRWFTTFRSIAVRASTGRLQFKWLQADQRWRVARSDVFRPCARVEWGTDTSFAPAALQMRFESPLQLPTVDLFVICPVGRTFPSKQSTRSDRLIWLWQPLLLTTNRNQI